MEMLVYGYFRVIIESNNAWNLRIPKKLKNLCIKFYGSELYQNENVIVIDGASHIEIRDELESCVDKYLSSNDSKYDGCIISIICIISKPVGSSSPQFYFDREEKCQHVSDLRGMNYRMADLPLLLYHGNAISYQTQPKGQRPSHSNEIHPNQVALNYEKFEKLIFYFQSMNEADKYINVLDNDGNDKEMDISNWSKPHLDYIKNVIEQGEKESKRIKIHVTETHWKDGNITHKMRYPYAKLV